MREFNPSVMPLSYSRLTDLAVSPSYFKYRCLLEDDKPSDAMILGSLVHCLITQQEKIESKYQKFEPEFTLRSNESKKRWQDAIDLGLIPIKTEQWNKAVSMAEAVRNNQVAKEVIRFEYEAEEEMRLKWIDKRTGISMKAFVDRYVKQKGLIVEFKTAADASPKKFMRDFFNFDYHCQDALYFDGLMAMEMEPRHVVNVVVESEPPHNVAVYNIPDEVLLLGRTRYSSLLDFFIKCRDENLWEKSYDVFSETGIHDITIPKWMMN